MKNRVWHKSFEPVIDKNSRALILGSFPSVKSREQGFYYGNKQNRFWKVLEKTFKKPVPEDIEGRKEFLLANKIALWDVIEASTIDGSMDSDLNDGNSKPVDVNSLVKVYPNIELIILNGKKALSVFERFNKECKVQYLYLPSTSPANASFDYLKWTNALKKFL